MTLNEFISANLPDYGSRYFSSYSFFRSAGVTEISEEITDYDEGGVTTRYVFGHGDKFYEMSIYSNSWSEYEDDFNDIEVTEVVPQEKTITVYVKKE